MLVTYNIQFSHHPEEIKRNILKMVTMGVSIFCLQEVMQSSGQAFIVNVLLKKLGGDWRVIYNLGKEKSKLGMGNCILWNTKVLTLEHEQKEFLPRYKTLALHEKIFSWIAGGVTAPFQRRVIVGYFKFNNVNIRITNLHLDQNGGLENRKKQLAYIINILLKGNTINQEVICGDFNSFDLLKREKEAAMQKVTLGQDFVDVSSDTGWTADLNNIDIDKGSTVFKFLIKKMHIHLKRKLDYIWVKNITSLKCEKLLLNGSDHKPLIVYLKI